MNVFIIPSWYPNAVQPLAGSFTQEQAEAIADLAPEIRVIVSTWGHEAGNLPVRSITRSLAALNWRLGQASDQISERHGVWEIFNPTLSWSRHLPLGGARSLLAVNRRNLRLALSHFGCVDLIHAHVSYPAGYLASILSREFDIPYVMTEHMSPFPFPSLMRRGRPCPEIEQAFSGAAATVAVSPAAASQIAAFGFRKPDVIPNLVDERQFTPGVPTSERFVFFTLCGLSDQKGIDQLLQGIAHWNPSADRVEFRIGGDGPKRAIYHAMAVQLGVADRIRWLGPISREDAPRWFQDCHCYVMPSRHETFGVAYAEAIASGKPVIATRCGGPESIVNEQNGHLVEIGDVGELSRAMQAMASAWKAYDPRRIRADFLQRFSRPAIVGPLTSLYRRVLEDD